MGLRRAEGPAYISPGQRQGPHPPFAHRLWESWKEAARRAGVKSAKAPGSGQVEGRFFGQHGRLRVTLEAGSALRPGTRMVIRDQGQGSGELTVEVQEKALEPGSRLGRLEIEVGDPAFDAEYSVQGDPLLAQAGLDAPTRAKLAALLGGEVKSRRCGPIPVEASFRRGELEVFFEHAREMPSEETADRLAEVLEAGLSLARQLAKPKDLASRLANRLGSGGGLADPEVGVRLRSLRLLGREFPGHAATQRALRAARGDSDEEVRLEGAIGEGERGRGTILALVGNPRISDGCAARAVIALGENLPFKRAATILAQALAVGRPELAKACLEAPCLLGRSDCESLMIEALSSPETSLVKVAALALGVAGTAAAVPALREAGERGDRELKRVCRQAIAEIQARLTGAGHGQLSIAAGEGGGLALVAEAEPGRLSLVEDGPSNRGLGEG